MKIASLNASVDTNNQSAASYDFSIGDVSTIIEILRNRLYSNPIRTLTQEYLSNARDSHREAGNERPISVTLPTKLDSVLKIRDYGVGLSKDRVRDVFVNYGISTKRTDNVQTGGFGLGAKSAWAYTDSFTVTSYFNGTCSTYVAHTGKSSNGTFELINECSTNEPNGVEIQIPVKENDISKFVDAVLRTTMFWDVRPELKGITEVEIPKGYATPSIKYRKDNIIICGDNSFNENLFETRYVSEKVFLLIDKIPYSIAKFNYQVEKLRKVMELVQHNNIVFIEVNNGVVDVAASREEVSTDKNNVAKLETICEAAVKGICDIIRDEFDKDSKTLNEYLEIYDGVKETFKAASVPKNLFRLEFSHDDVRFEMIDSFKNMKCNKFLSIYKYYLEEQKTREVMRCESKEYVQLESGAKIVLADVVVGDSVLKHKMRRLLSEGVPAVYYVAVEAEDVDKIEKCADALLVSDLEYESVTVKAKKRLAGIVNIRKLFVNRQGRYAKVDSEGKKEMTLEQIEREGKYAIVPFAAIDKFDYGNDHFIRMVRFLSNNGYTVIKCSKKDYEEIIELENVNTYDEVVDNLEVYVPISNQAIEDCVFQRMSKSLQSLRQHQTQINCPKVKELLTLYPTRNNRSEHSDDVLQKYSHYKVAVAQLEKISKLEQQILEKYPLLQQVSDYYRGGNGLTREYVYYINSKYESTAR
jgi:hypothetical protein